MQKEVFFFAVLQAFILGLVDSGDGQMPTFFVTAKYLTSPSHVIRTFALAKGLERPEDTKKNTVGRRILYLAAVDMGPMRVVGTRSTKT